LQHAACNGSWDDRDRFDFVQALSSFASAESPNAAAEVWMVLVEHSHSLGVATVVYLGTRNPECAWKVTDVLAGLVRQRNSQSRHLAVVPCEKGSCGMRFVVRGWAIGRRPVSWVETSF
jgi:hypothetical protein